MYIELGHYAPQVRLNYGLRLLAMSGDHETEPWAYRRKTLYSTDEWVQRRMARNARTECDVEIDQRHEPATEWDRESFEAEFRIWDDEQRAARAIEQSAEHHARQKKWHESREARRHLWATQRAGIPAGDLEAIAAAVESRMMAAWARRQQDAEQEAIRSYVREHDAEVLELLHELDLLEP